MFLTPSRDGTTSTLCGNNGSVSGARSLCFEVRLPSGKRCFGISTGGLAPCAVAGRLAKSLIETVPTKVAGDGLTFIVADWAAAAPQAVAIKLAANNARNMDS
ncbi:MAG: hypothetical protein ACREDJ_10970 [Methylocella sp.]